MSLVLLWLSFPLCNREAELSISQYRKYHLDVWMTVSSVSMSYSSLHQTLIISSCTLMTHFEAKHCQGAADQHLTTAGNFREGASFGGNRKIILAFFYGFCSERGEQKGGEPWLDGGVEEGSACTRWLGGRREGTGPEGTSWRMKLDCEELGRAQSQVWAGFREEASHIFTENLPISN